jgi:hypothetical protein
MKYIKKFNEDINLPIKVGDTILGGRFKNKKVIVKKIGKNKKGDITVNDKPLLKYRIVKESISQKDIDDGLAYLMDEGFKVTRVKVALPKYGDHTDMIQIFKPKEGILTQSNVVFSHNMNEIRWSDIESDLLPFIELYRDSIKKLIVTFPISETACDREVLSVNEILEYKGFDIILKVTILVKSN